MAWWWMPHGQRVIVGRGKPRPTEARDLDRKPADEAEAMAIARGMALAEAEGRLRDAG